MTTESKDVYLIGSNLQGAARAGLITQLAAAFKKDIATIEKMLRRPRTLIKANVELAIAQKYQHLIERCGGSCELLDHGQAPAPINPNPSSLASPDLPPTTNPPPSPSLQLTPMVEASPPVSEVSGYQDIRGQVAPAPVEFTRKRKLTAALLALFVGGSGLHRLYLGQWWGVFYVLFWPSLVSSLVSLVEAVVFWRKPQAEWDKRYGQVPPASRFFRAMLVVWLVAFLALAGILAWVGVPIYKEYYTRARIATAMPAVDAAKDKVAEFVKKMRSYPSDNVLVGLPDVIHHDAIASIKLTENAQLVVTYKMSTLEEKNTIVWAPTEQNGNVVWSCYGGTVLEKYRPMVCRGNAMVTAAARMPAPASPSLSQTLFSSDKSVSITVPTNWKLNPKLLEGALIAADNSLEDSYLVLMAEAKADFEQDLTFDQYVQLIQKQVGTYLNDNQLIGATRKRTIAGFPAQQFVVYGNSDGIKIAYVITIVATESHYYRLLTWTKQSRFDDRKKLFESISETFNLNRP